MINTTIAQPKLHCASAQSGRLSPWVSKLWALDSWAYHLPLKTYLYSSWIGEVLLEKILIGGHVTNYFWKPLHVD